MATLNLFILLLATPLVAAILAFLVRFMGTGKSRVATLIHIIGMVVLAIASWQIIARMSSQGELLAAHQWLHLDSLAALFLAILAIVGVLTGVHSIGYMRHELAHGEISDSRVCNYYGFFHLFLFTMLLVITTNNLILMWAAIEATTLSSAFLVGIYGKRSSLEAAWKYIIICTVGVAFGLYGTILVYSNAASVMSDPSQAIFWTEVMHHTNLLDGTLMHLAFIFILIGFGTKTGLFPMHAWLPDAHSEAASPTSALLSAVLLNCALLVIIRYSTLISGAIGPQFPHLLLMIFGLLSVGVAAFLILVQRDMKRLLAYSSMENMGLIAFALGLGGPIGVFAAMLHTLNHSLAKTLLFCGSGNVLLKFGSRDMTVVKGILRVTPFTGALLAGGALALGGVPPFNVFLSEMMTVTAGIHSGHWILILILLAFLTVVLAGLVRMIVLSVLGKAPENVARGELGWLTTVPMAVLLVMMVIMGTHIPGSVGRLLVGASEVVTQSDGLALQQPLSMQSWLPTAQVTVPATTQSVSLSVTSSHQEHYRD
ncbi:hydrogenase 4 subunit F [Celerinatantimonas sp. YJH-8]|uniref:hydrogenase 4 subunit F n=1 Tax=Celerinatantimonas sp. YJH-8 TaxID=3228714 RepID=UPI0038CBBCDA